MTTSGSPPPNGVIPARIEPVVLRDGSIGVRSLIPRGQTAFRVTNAGTVPHTLAVDAPGSHAALGAPLAPGQTMLLQMIVTGSRYRFHCTIAGHEESSVVRTYQPQ